MLLSLETQYPAALQLATDMLSVIFKNFRMMTVLYILTFQRSDVATEEIVEILLSKQHVLDALRYDRFLIFFIHGICLFQVRSNLRRVGKDIADEIRRSCVANVGQTRTIYDFSIFRTAEYASKRHVAICER